MRKNEKQQYIVTDGNHCYFKHWDEVDAIIVLDDMLGYEADVKKFDNKEKAKEVAEHLGWEVREV